LGHQTGSKGVFAPIHVLVVQVNHSPLPRSIATLRAACKMNLTTEWAKLWKALPRYPKLAQIDPRMLSTKSFHTGETADKPVTSSEWDCGGGDLLPSMMSRVSVSLDTTRWFATMASLDHQGGVWHIPFETDCLLDVH